MRVSLCLHSLCLVILAGCQTPQEEDRPQAFVGKWYHVGFQIDGKPLPDRASSPFYEFEAGGDMYAYKSPGAPVPDERGWFEVIGPNELRMVGDGDGGKEDGVKDEGEIASAVRMRWKVEGDTLQMSTTMHGQVMTIMFQRGWPGSNSDR